MESEETEIGIELFIQICELRRTRSGPSSRYCLAHFRKTEQVRAAKLARVGQVSVQDARSDSTARPPVGSGPADVSGFAPEIRQTSLRGPAK